MDYIEVSGKTKEDAIIKASMELETPSGELDIDVISEGSKGFLGFGSKPFVIRARKRPAEKAEETEAFGKTEEFEKIEEIEKIKESEKIEETEEIEEAAAAEPVQPKAVEADIQQPKTDLAARGQKGSEQKPAESKVMESKAAEQKNSEQQRKTHRPKREARKIEVLTDDGQIEEVKQRAEAFLSDVFQAMGISVQMEAVYNKEDGSLTIDFSGENMGVLIGKRGQTLDSLQYLTGLVLNKGNNVYVKVKLDTENYRARRKETLENLAKGIASKVRRTKKPVVLEAMNPYERRIIHSALQGNRSVETFSEGEEPYRHIVVRPRAR